MKVNKRFMSCNSTEQKLTKYQVLREGVVSFLLCKKKEQFLLIVPFLKNRCWHQVIFPGGGPPSIFAEISLYDRVRDDSAEQNNPANCFARGGGFLFALQ